MDEQAQQRAAFARTGVVATMAHAVQIRDDFAAWIRDLLVLDAEKTADIVLAVNEALAMRTGQGLVLATDAVERYVVDGAVEGAAAGTGAVGRLTRRTESGYVRSYAGYMLAGTVLVLIAVLAARF